MEGVSSPSPSVRGFEECCTLLISGFWQYFIQTPKRWGKRKTFGGRCKIEEFRLGRGSKLPSHWLECLGSAVSSPVAVNLRVIGSVLSRPQSIGGRNTVGEGAKIEELRLGQLQPAPSPQARGLGNAIGVYLEFLTRRG